MVRCLAVMLLLLLASPARARPVSQLQIDADHLELAGQGSTIRLRGSVRVRGVTTRGEVSISARQVSLRLDPRGNPVALDAEGQVELRLADSSGKADRLRLLGRAGQVLELVGHARLELHKPRLRVAGQRIWIQIETGRVTVDRPRVELEPPASRADARPVAEGPS